MSDSIIVFTKLKEMVGDMNVAGGFQNELDQQVRELVDKAVKRARANGRKTIMAKDL
ncbi:DUF1931 domain-containing protein [Candidatus Woesearchaeota archaeon CG_4_10_14_0_8_um_filter_47_5]|nr:MAG: DUF1931 domain-containing protein [Candidatus Woesearchaeota archaeon CG_4_10_14_0_8_um_filter_47_5]